MPHFIKPELSAKVFNLVTENFSEDEVYAAVSLQGVVAQNKAEISIDIPADFRLCMEEEYGLSFEDTEDLWSVAEKFKSQINGIILYDDIKDVNKACTAAGAYGCWALPASLLEKAEGLGLAVKLNASTEYKSEFEAFKKCRDLLDNTYICHQLPDNSRLRDYAIAVKAPLYADNDKSELDEIYTWVKDTGAVLGWYYDEVSGVGYASKYGLMTIPSDHAKNMSLYAALPCEKQKQKPIARKERDTKKVHYVTFLLSDGDNVQVHINNYRTDNFSSKKRGTLPFGWSTSPAMYDLAPLINKWYYERQTDEDNFLAAVSGVGYCNPALLPKAVLPKFAELSAEYMKNSDICNTVMLMDTPEEQLIDRNETKINNLFEITKAYSQYDGISGGFFYYGNLYCPVKTPGAVFWSNGKPFNSIRETLWHSGDKHEYMKNLAEKINGYTKDCTVIEGYTAINVQYWQYNFDEVAEFAAMLNDDVVVVTPKEFIEIMTKNIADKTDKLFLGKDN